MSNPRWTRKTLLFFLQPIFRLIFFISIFLIGEAAGIAQATNFAIGTTVQRSSVKRLGVNLGGQDYYDSGQMLRNLIYRNPGFEGETWQSILQCAAVTSTSCTDQNPWSGWPANFLQGATFEFIYGAAKGQTGTVSGNTVSAYTAGNATNPNYGVTLNFSSPLSPAPAVGDYLIVKMSIPGNAQAGWWPGTSGGGTLSTDSTDIAPDSPGKQALAMSASQSGQSANVTEWFDSWGSRSFVQLNGTYTLSFKAKGQGGNNQLNVLVQRLASAPHGTENFIDQNVTLTNQWQDYSYSFTASEDGSYLGPAQVAFAVSGGSAYLDDVSLTEQAAADNPTAFRNAVVDTLRQLKPGVLRYMDSGTDFGSSIDNMLAVPYARQRAGYSDGGTEQDDVPLGLPEFLTLCQAVGAEPWYTAPAGMSPTEMQNLIEYLGGAASTPYGAIRASLGQSAPWTSVFPKIHLELGNEMWNFPSFEGEGMGNPVAYANRAATIFAAARASASYNSGSFDLIMDGWAANVWTNQQELANSSGYDTIDVAPYLFNTLSDTSSNEAIFGPMFAQPEQEDSNASGLMAQQAQAAATAGSTPANLAVYEVNLSTVSGTAPQNVLDPVVAGVGAGLAVTDHMLLMMRDLGITTQNMYALPEYENSFSNTATGAGEYTPLWGSVVDMGGETNLKRPQFLAEQLANQAILPSMLQVAVSGANPTWNQPLSANDTIFPIQLANAHYLQSFAFTDGTHYSMIVFNLSRSGSLPVTFSGANAPTGNVLISQLTSQNITDNNENLTSNAPVVSTTQANASNFNPAAAYSLPPFSMTVFQWPNSTLPVSTTTLTATPTSGTTGQSIGLTATVASQSGTNTPTGTVTFMQAGASIGTGTLNANGVATLNTTTLPAGADSITAAYGGDSADAGSTSSAVTINITSNAVPTGTTLTASATAVNTGQNVTFTAVVTAQSGNGVPAGTVTFMSGSASLGTGTLNASGVATFNTASLPAGNDSVTASYGGTNSDASSVSSAVTLTVTQTVTATTTTLSSSSTQATPGQNVTFTAAVAPQSGNTIPVGAITFLNGTTVLGAGTLNANGTASFSTTELPVGANSITASYGGSTSNSTSVSAAVIVNVTPSLVATTTSLTASPTAIDTGQTVTFTASVTPQSGGKTLGGTVTFLNGTTILGTGTLNASGIATLSTGGLPAGSASITASYGGNTTYSSSLSPTVVVTVTQTLVATATSLNASATQITVGQNVTFTATVVPQSGTATPSGMITLLDGAATLATATLNAGGMASFSTVALTAGTHTITASYAGSTANSASVSMPATITVAPAPIQTNTTLIASATTIDTGQTVTFTATVTPKTGSAGVPLLPVAFLNGSAIIGTAAVNANGVAIFTATLPAGAESITASYTGNASDLSSVSAPVLVTVTQSVAGTATTLSASATQINSGESVVLTASVAPQSGSAKPAGTVTFLDGSITLGTATLNASSTAFFSASALAVGTHSITASYNGSLSDAKSMSSPVSIIVAQSIVATSTTLTASAAQLSYGRDVTFSATVVPQSGAGIPAGMVSFLDGSTILGTAQLSSSGAAFFTTQSLAPGSHAITASYGGSNSNSSSISAPFIVTVIAESGGPVQNLTIVNLSSSATQIYAGQNVSLTAAVTAHPAGAIASGSVTFFSGKTMIGVAALDSSGNASLNTSTLSVGMNSITATYGGNDVDAGSTSAPLNILVTAQPVTPPASPITPAPGPIATTTTLTTSAAQVSAGDSVSFVASVAAESGSGMLAGTVTFLDGQNLLGTSILNGSGAASFATSSLAAGTHSITASYAGDAADGPSISAAVMVTVATPSSPGYTMAVSSSDVVLTRGEVANLTVTLTPQNGFDMPVNLTCSGLPSGTTCSFNPATVTPAGKPVSSTLSILAEAPSVSENKTSQHSGQGRLALGLVMPWGMLSLIGFSRRKSRSRFSVWAMRLTAAAVLAAGSLWMSGCGYSVNGSVFTMTLTSSGDNAPTHTSQIRVTIAQ